jgi:hypothetical protein
LRIHYIGETYSEFDERMKFKIVADTMYEHCRVKTPPATPPQVVEQMGSTIWSASGNVTPTPRSPLLSSLGLSGFKTTNLPVSTIISQVQGMPDASVEQIEKIKSISAPSTPILPTTEAWARGNSPITSTNQLQVEPSPLILNNPLPLASSEVVNTSSITTHSTVSGVGPSEPSPTTSFAKTRTRKYMTDIESVVSNF